MSAPYGQWAWAPAPPIRPGGALVPNVAGLAVTVLGAALALLGTFLEWYENAGLAEIRAATESLDDKPLALAYFGGGLWLLLAVTFTAAIAANVGFGQVIAMSAVAVVTAGIGILAAVGILADLAQGRSWTAHSAAGLWLTLAGFAVAGIGGLSARGGRVRTCGEIGSCTSPPCPRPMNCSSANPSPF